MAEDSKREIKLTVRVTAKEHEDLKEKAFLSGKALAVYIREVSLGTKLSRRFSSEELERLKPLPNVANNLNQAIKQMHLKGLDATANQLQAVLNQVNDLIKRFYGKG